MKKFLFFMFVMLVWAFTIPLGALEARTFTWSHASEFTSMDPHVSGAAQTMQQCIYEALVRYKSDLTIEGALAVSWKLIEPTRWRFQLRKGVLFHDGRPFTADDVVFSIDRAKSEGSDLKEHYRNINMGVTIDEHTVDIITKSPDPIMLNLLRGLIIMSKSWCADHKVQLPAAWKKGKENYATFHANGTGPFELVKREVDVRTEMVANEDWWDVKKHNFAKIVFRPISDPSTRVAALLAGEVDLIEPVPVQDIKRLKANPNVDVAIGPGLRTVYFGLDQYRSELLGSKIKGKNPFKDVRVRKAIYQAIDIDAIHDKVMRGQSFPTGLMIGPGVNGFDPELNKRYPYDREAAKKLLAEAGYSDGFSFAMDCPNDRYVNDEEICLAVVSMLAKIGVKAKLNAQPKALYFPKVIGKKTSFYMFGWLISTVDGNHALSSLIRSNAKFNIGGYSNSDVDELIKKIAVEMAPKVRIEMMHKAFIIHKEEFGHIPLHQQVLLWGVRKGLKVVQVPTNVLPVYWFRFE